MTPLTRPVRRAVPGRRSYVVILSPESGGVIEVREKGRRKGFAVAVEGLYYLLAVRAADLSRSERKAKRGKR